LRERVEADATELIGATGLGEDFGKVQRTISRLRDNLLRSPDAEANSGRVP
jgi:hypothetical protein